MSLAEIGESELVLEDFLVDTRYIPQTNSAVIDVLPEMAGDSILVRVRAGTTTGLAEDSTIARLGPFAKTACSCLERCE